MSRPLRDDEILDLVESGHRRSRIEQGLLLFGATRAEAPVAELLAAPLGARDRALLELRRATFGPELSGLAPCPRCGELLELTLAIDRLLVEPECAPPSGCIEHRGLRLGLRPVSSGDLHNALRAGSDEAARRTLLLSCVASIEGAHRSLDDGDLDRIAEALEDLDPQADLTLSLACEACGREWTEAFDIVSFLWRELEARSRRVLLEVDQLARCYGWSEAEILGLSPARRGAYLGLVST